MNPPNDPAEESIEASLEPAKDSVPSKDFARHTFVENAAGLFVGILVISFGLFILKSVGAVTGGVAGLALLLSYALPVPFWALLLIVNVPFLFLAIARKGWGFTLRTMLAIAMLSAFSLAHPYLTPVITIDPVFATLFGNLLIGMGLLVLFRHNTSLGGVTIVALILQERLGWRAGYVQMVFDVLIVLSAFAVVPVWNVALSAIGAMVLNLVLAMNHKPGRYTGH
ncbi:YitT family protein [Humidisolicoccus flavus]|uniref:YitT family protein n=1 Tax=Humidisolicoccus flavus TaxID=3111414 RepID=UPI003247DBB1